MTDAVSQCSQSRWHPITSELCALAPSERNRGDGGSRAAVMHERPAGEAGSLPAGAACGAHLKGRTPHPGLESSWCPQGTLGQFMRSRDGHLPAPSMLCSQNPSNFHKHGHLCFQTETSLCPAWGLRSCSRGARMQLTALAFWVNVQV